MDTGAWRATVYDLTKSRTQLRDFHFCFIFPFVQISVLFHLLPICLSIYLFIYVSFSPSLYVYFEIVFRKGILFSSFIFLSILIIATVSVPFTRKLDSS